VIAKEEDFYAWSCAAASALRSPGELSRQLREEIAEEIQSLGGSQKWEVYHRLGLVLMHMLKWDYQPLRRSRSWQHTIQAQRVDLEKVLRENPSLRARLEEEIPEAYEWARNKAAAQTGLEFETFPPECPYGLEQIRGNR
jgi:hypothetical protein